ncbi:MAG: 50S ribosomal protein L25/general stress protein Ctc [Smithellaceae bacterium]|nr:50S ribosomal protein L25/general stress protein Ctc [Smithellaceae bacterium]
MEISELKAEIRSAAGKGSARKLRAQGIVPAVYYGPQAETIMLSVKSADLLSMLKKKEEHVFIKLVFEEAKKKKQEKLCMIKELQKEPLGGRFYHVDFYAVSMDHKITSEVPLHFVGKAAGVENGDGELQHIRRELKVSCLPTDLPDHIAVDLSGLGIGDVLKIKDLTLPAGITVLDSEDAPIASVVAVKAAAPVEAPAPEAAEEVKEAPKKEEES